MLKTYPSNPINMKQFFIKSTTLLLVVLFACMQIVSAQCTANTTNFPTGTINAGTGTLVTIANNNYEGEYARITGIVTGSRYRFTISAATDIITVRVGTFNGTVLGFGSGSVTVTAGSTSDLFVHFNTSTCGTAAVNRTTTVQALPTITTLGSTTGCTGASIVINGTNLSGATTAGVTIGGTAVAAITTNTATQIVATIGTGTTGNVVVNNGAGNATSASSFTVNQSPLNRTISAVSTSICSGTGTNIQVASSQTGISYQLRDNAGNVNVGVAVSGTGGTINLPTGNLTTSTTYNVLATNSVGGCTLQMTGTLTVTVNQTPTNKTISAAASSVCSGTGTNIVVASSQTTINYQLRNNADNSNIGTAVAGTGANINLPTGNIIANMTYNVLATSTAGSCILQMSGTVSVSTTASPLDKTLTPAVSSICSGGNTTIQVANSQLGVNYQLRNNTSNVNIGSTVSGTGLAINLNTGSLTTNTTFNVLATSTVNGCFAQMSSLPTVNVTSPTATAGPTINACQSLTPSAITLSGASVGGGATTGAWSIIAGVGTLSSTAQTASPELVTFLPNDNYTGTITLQLTTNNPSGCSAGTSTRNIVVNAKPVATITANHCVGGGVVRLTVNSFASYLWNTTGQTTQSIDVLTAGNYVVTVTDVNGCVATDTYTTGTELVTNGDFNAGNTGFTTAYIYQANVAGQTELYPEGTYGVGNNANDYHNAFNGTDHTSGSGNFMIINGIVTADRIVWSQNNIAVTPNTTYYFSAWGLTVVNGNNAILRFSINGTQVGSSATLPDGYTNAAGPFAWTRFFGSWNSGSNTVANLSIVNLQIAAGGNDFGLDDISFSNLPPLTLSTAPSSGTGNSICAGNAINLLGNVSGGNYPLTYAWTGPSSFTSTVLNPTITPAVVGNTGVYNLTVTDKYGCSTSGSSATVTVQPALANNTITASQSICTNTIPVALAGTTPTGGTGTYTYLWESSTTSATTGFTTASGTSNGVNYTPATLYNTTWYRRTVTSGACSNTSATVQITVSPALATNTITAAQTICTATAPNALVGSTPTGGNGTYTYLWEASTTSATAGFVTASGTSNSINYSPGTLTQNIWYRRTVTSGGCSNTSATVLITVNPVIGNHIVSAPQSICSGSTPSPLTNTTPTGGNGAYNYLWESSTTSATTGFATASGTNNFQNYNPPALTQTTWYRTTITSGGCTSVATAIEVTVTPTITTNTITADQSICTSTTPATLNGAAATGGNGTYTYAWQSSTTSATFGFVAASGTNNSQNYSPAALTQTTWYRRVVTSGSCTNTSATVQVTVSPVIGSNTITAAQIICTGSTPAALIGSTPNGGNSTYTYLWESSTTSAVAGFGTAAGTSNTINYSPGALTQNTWYRRTVTSGGCSNTATAIQITITAVIGNNTISNAQTICSGSSATILTGSTPTGGNGTYAYTWQSSTTSASTGFATASGTSNTINYSPGILTQTTWFRRLVTSGGCTDNVMVVQILINATGQWIGGASGNWNVAGNWCGGIPTSSTNVTIPSGSVVSIQTANAVANSVTIATGGTLTMTGANNLTITAGGSFNNTGTFTASSSTGTVLFNGNGTITGTTTFQNIDTKGALNFGTSSTVNGNFTLQTGGSVTGNAPTYICPTSTLIYKTGGTFSRGIEWATNPTGQGYPSNVIVQSSTTIDFPIPGQGYICNDLTIEDGSILNQNFASGSARLQVGRNVNIMGTLTLGGSIGGDLNLGGNWTRTSTGVFNHNERKVTFDGTGNFSGRGTASSTISAPSSAFKDNEGGFGGEKFAHLWMNKTATTDSIVLLSNITITREIGFTRGTFSLKNSDVTIVSNSSRTADVAPITTPANINIRYAGTGRFNIQRFVQNPTAVRSWRLLTAPVEAASAPTINTAWQYGMVNPNKTDPSGADGIYNPWPSYGTHITGPGGAYNLANGFDQGTNTASILQATANVAGWVAPLSTKSTLVTDQQGWMLFVRGDRGFAIGNQYAPAQDATLETRGKILTGNVVKPVAAVKQVIANPYASAISLLDVDICGIAGKNASYHMWDPKMFTSYTQPGKWVSFTGVGNSFIYTTSASSYANNGTIESGQAFIVQPTFAGNITFKESDKLALTSSLTGVANRPTNNPSNGLNAATVGILRTDLYVNNGGTFTLTDAVVNLFDNSYSRNVTVEDANKLITFNTKESLSIQRDSSKLAIEKRSNIIAADTIFYSTSKLNELPYQFKFKAANLNLATKAYLIDKFTGGRTEVNIDGETVVDFVITSDPLSKVIDRFKLVFKPMAPLPVTFTNVQAKKVNNDIAVEWTVENEININHYTVEKSSNGTQFSVLGTVPSLGNSTGVKTYSQLDVQPSVGDHFYRIKSTSNDAINKYSAIVKVNIGSTKNSISLYPNPIVNGTVSVQINNEVAGTYTCRLVNTIGQVLAVKEVKYTGGTATVLLDIDKVLAKGIHQVQIIKPDNTTTILQVLNN